MIYKFAKIKFKQLDLTYRASSSWSRNRLSTKLDTAISRQHTLAKICVRSICNMKEQLIPLSKRIRWINSVNILSFFFLSPLIQNWTVATQNTLVSSFHWIFVFVMFCYFCVCWFRKFNTEMLALKHCSIFLSLNEKGIDIIHIYYFYEWFKLR